MAELNDKLITYGNLSTFYDKLQEQGLGGDAIENVSVLPDASENKNKFVRLSSDKKVYFSELVGTSTEEVNAPDSEQINNATVTILGDEWIYRGFFNLMCDDGIYPTKISFWQLGSTPEYTIGTLQASVITNISDGDWASGYDEVSINNDTATMPLEISDVEIALGRETPTSISIVKQTVTTETWDWKKVATEQYVDDAITDIKPITNVSVLPDAEANKDSVLRLNGDEQVYISKTIAITPTNRLPDAQQIGKAYIYNDNIGDCLYYKGNCTLEAQNGTFAGFLWLNEIGNSVIVTLDNAENISMNGKDYTYNVMPVVSGNTVYVNDDASEEVLSDIDCYPIPAIYNAPESAQIGNATLIDILNVENGLYTGEQITFKDVDTEEQITGYKWEDLDDSNHCFATDKPASQIYFAKIDDDYEGGYFIYTDVKVWYVDLRDNTAEQVGISNVENGLYIPQLNAPDSEQVGNATRILTTTSGLFYRGDTLYTLIDDYNHSYTGYKWSNDDETNFTFTLKKASEMYGDSDTYVVDNYVDFWEYLGNNTYRRTDEEPFGTPYEVEIRNFNIVKYQRTQGWQWNKVVTEDELDVKPITNVSELPDSDTNKDKVLRLEGDNKVYISYGSENAYDYEQVGNAKIIIHDERGYDTNFDYSGEIWTLVLGNTQVSGYLWWGDDNESVIVSQNNAASIYDLNENVIDLWYEAVYNYNHTDRVITVNGGEKDNINWIPLSNVFSGWGGTRTLSIVKKNWKPIVTKDILDDKFRDGIDESTFTGATLTVDGSQPSIVASGTTTIAWVTPNVSGKTVEVSVVVINTGNSALTPTMSGNYQMMGSGNLTIQAGELGLYRGRYISALNKWLIEAIYQEVSGIME